MGRPIDPAIALRLHERIQTLGSISEDPDQLTRRFLSPAMQRANAAMFSWARESGLEMHIDPGGNLRARWGNIGENRPCLVLGSHLDTVRNAGKYDGPLGVLSALACVEQLKAWGVALPFDLEVVGFSDEEGLRFHTAYLGSSYFVGSFLPKWLELTDADGKTVADALREFGSDPDLLLATQAVPQNLLGYLELHIEQGPLLEVEDCATGVVSAIAGQSRINIVVTGKAGHAGTTPMDIRRDALCAAAEIITMIETVARRIPLLRATVGQLRVDPGASNVIPEVTRFTLDIRQPNNEILHDAIEAIHAQALEIVRVRRVALRWDFLQQTPPVPMDPVLTNLLRESAESLQGKAPVIVSGAGHDAVAMAKVCPVAMLFVRCRQGLSHHPDEYVSPADVEVGLSVLVDAVCRFAQHHELSGP